MNKLGSLAITGIGMVSPLGEDASSLLAALDARRSGIVEVNEAPLPQPSWAGRVGEFSYQGLIPAMRARRLDRASLFAVVAAHRAVASAGLTGAPLLEHQLGVVMGTGSAGSGPLTVFLDALYRRSPQDAPPFEFPNTVANAPASHVSIELGLKAANTTLSHSEAVMGIALATGRLMIADGRCSHLLVGAVDEWNPYYDLGYRQLGALRRCQHGGGGTVLSEGATALVAELPATAAERGAPVLATLSGVGVSSAPGEPFRWVADRSALRRAIHAALEDAELEPAQVGSVFLAANGLEAMEKLEAEVLGEIFSTPLAATGIKGAVGERACSGALSLAVATLARHRGTLPPYAGGALNRWPKPIQILETPTSRPPGATLVVLYGFGGNFAALVVT